MNKDIKQVTRRPTSQREMVLDSICQGNHPSAREIYENITRKTRMSFGTVYRNLQILEEEKEIISVQADPNALRYDRRTEPHYHFHCRKCGNVFDVPCRYQADIDSIDKKVSKKSGFIVESHTIVFEGLCQECAANGT
ncbi:MAG: transcriptional repressor [Treponema sp.]|jgi:Fur family peroxide stress response transcriptional regulator|nr:transcriptional repressor [Treponema sp.]